MPSTFKLEKIPNVAVFRAGDYGDKGSFSVDDLKAIASDYNDKGNGHEAPITKDHEGKGPKFGSIDKGSVRVEGDLLYADLSVHPGFADVVRQRFYDKRSIELYKDRAADGKPKQGYALRAVTFLGAQPPEVKGLPEIMLSESDEAINIEFSEPREPITESKVRDIVTEVLNQDYNFKESCSMDKPEDKEKKMVPMAELDAMTAQRDKLQGELDAIKNPKKVEMSETEKALTAKVEAMEKEREEAKLEAFSEKLKTASNEAKAKGIAPAVIEKITALAFSEFKGEEVVKFGEGDTAKEFDRASATLDILASIPATTLNKQTAGNSVEFSEKQREKATKTPEQLLNERAKAIQAEKNVNFSEALNRALEESKEIN